MFLTVPQRVAKVIGNALHIQNSVINVGEMGTLRILSMWRKGD